MRSFRSALLLPSLALAGAGILGVACSSNPNDPESAGGSSATGGSSGTKGGSSSGGSSAKPGSGGTSGSSGTGAKGGTTGGTGASASGGTSSTSGGTGNSTSSGGTGGSGAYPTDACEGLAFDMGGQGGDGSDACTGVSNEAEPVPIDLFIMMDRSVSMANAVPGSTMTRWEALQQAVEEFVSGAGSADIRAGIGFFGITGGNDDTIDCNESRYAKPAVEIGALGDVGTDLVAAMADKVPGGLTPAGPALTGALEHAAAWAKDNPGRATAVVLVTDGFPTQCTPLTVSGLAMIAEQAHLNEPFVRTYVIGLGGDYNLDAIALSGGTHQAYKVDEGDIASSFADALRNVTNTKIACDYALPPPPSGSTKLDLTKVQVTYTTASGSATEEIPSVPNLEACSQASNGGWYYDNPVSPTSIQVCPCTCARFEAGRVDVRVGCKPRVGIR